MSTFTKLDQLNAMDQSAFVATVGDVFEHAEWVAEAAFAARPFSTVTALHDAMVQAVKDSPPEQQFAFIRGHPELGGKVAQAGIMTDASKAEQGALGLNRLSGEEFQRFQELNSAYREKFGIPFVICVARHTRR